MSTPVLLGGIKFTYKAKNITNQREVNINERTKNQLRRMRMQTPRQKQRQLQT